MKHIMSPVVQPTHRTHLTLSAPWDRRLKEHMTPFANPDWLVDAGERGSCECQRDEVVSSLDLDNKEKEVLYDSSSNEP